MRSIIICIALVTALLFFSGSQPQLSLALGSKGGVMQPESAKKNEGQIEGDREDGKSGEGISPKEKSPPEKNKASPQKKPRIKYREEPGCSC